MSNLELLNLQAVLGNLEQTQTEGQLLENLDRLDEVYSGILRKLVGYDPDVLEEYGFGDLVLEERGRETGIPPKALQMLGNNPDEQMIRDFDEVFGPGAAAKALGR